MSDRILFLSNGSICYDSTTYFIECISEELKAMGWEVMHIRLDKATQKDKLCVLADEYDSQPFDYVFDINTKLDAVCDDSGRYCFDRLGKAVWHYILDHPFYHHDSLKVPLKNMNVICLDEMHKKFIDETYPHINSCIVLPLAAKQAESGLKPYDMRENDLVFTASYTDPDMVYFKAKKQAEIFEQDLQQKDQEMYDLKHELISLKMQIEEAKKAEQEAQEQKNLLDGKVKELEKELDELLK